jgi:hypothetical protein
LAGWVVARHADALASPSWGLCLCYWHGFNTCRPRVVVQFEFCPARALCAFDRFQIRPVTVLSMRMGNRRMTRLTNVFSKKATNHAHMMAIYFMHYNFVRIHQTLKITPAMAAGVTSKLWEMADMVKVLEDWELAR